MISMILDIIFRQEKTMPTLLTAIAKTVKYIMPKAGESDKILFITK